MLSPSRVELNAFVVDVKFGSRHNPKWLHNKDNTRVAGEHLGGSQRVKHARVFDTFGFGREDVFKKIIYTRGLIKSAFIWGTAGGTCPSRYKSVTGRVEKREECVIDTKIISTEKTTLRYTRTRFATKINTENKLTPFITHYSRRQKKSNRLRHDELRYADHVLLTRF